MTSAPSFDLITVGSGHNALITSAYAAKAGLKVGVFERRDIVGGAVSSAEIIPGYRFDYGGSAHILIRLTPIVQELALETYGLTYIDIDPLFFAPFPDGDSLFFYRDEARTCEHLEQKFPGEGEAYARFLADWRPFARVVKELFLLSPSPLNLGRKMLFSNALKKDWQRALRSITKPYGEVVDDYFKEEKIKAPLVWMAAQSGPPPTEPLNAPFLLWHPLYHEGGMARPRGGSGMLTQALANCIRDHGGQIFTGAGVTEILVERGKTTGVRVGDAVYTAKAVLSGTHAIETFHHLLPEAHRPPLSQGMRTGNGFGAIIRLALDKPIQYSACPNTRINDDARKALQLICPERSQINRAFGEYLAGKPTSDPPLVAMSFSAVDDTLAPPGKEVLWLWAQYYPYALAHGQHWEEISEQVSQRILDTFERYTPGTNASIVGQLFQHPKWLEDELGLYKGNVMHLEMTLDQMFALRPFLGMSQYKTHIRNLFITGASTHPGGGIMGASGRNAARVVLKAFRKKL